MKASFPFRTCAVVALAVAFSTLARAVPNPESVENAARRDSPAAIRFAITEVRYSLLGVDRTQQVELRPDGPADAIIKYAHDPDDLSYDYEVRWRQYGGQEKISERLNSADRTILADELGMQ